MAPWRLVAIGFVIIGMAVFLLLGTDIFRTTPSSESVTINGHDFTLRVAADAASRYKGLGGLPESELAANEGMLFVFPQTDVGVHRFVMRDCHFDIDIMFISSVGTVTAIHEMKTDPRRSGESDDDYERRLEPYSSVVSAQYAIELKGGWLKRLDVQTGDRIDLNYRRLKHAAQ